MPNDLNYGYQVPSAGDESRRQWMPIISAFIRRIITHAHDGEDSSLLTSVGINADTVVFSSGKTTVVDAVYTIGAATADIGILTVTGGMYGYGDDIPLEAKVVSGGTSVITFDKNFTASSTGGTLIFSGYKKVDDSLWQAQVLTPAGTVSRDKIFKIYISSSGDNQFETIYPTVVSSESRTLTVEVCDDQYDLTFKVV